MRDGPFDSGGKSPVFVESGRRGAAKRWAGHTPRIVRLDDLTNPQRRLVMALVDAARKEASPVSETPGEANAEGHGNDRSAA